MRNVLLLLSDASVRLVGILGLTQILAWGTTFYLPAVLAAPIAQDSGWPLSAVVAGLSWGFLVAGVCAPRAGRLIDRFGGRPVLASSSLLLATGLSLMGAAPNITVYFFAWTVLGLAMAGGLYDAAFSTLGRLFGEDSRTAMTGVTLLGGFASTVAWPAITALEVWLGWRGTCLVLAGVHLTVGLPLYLLVIPREAQRSVTDEPMLPADRHPATVTATAQARLIFVLVAVLFTLQSSVMSSVSVLLLDTLAQLGFAASVALAVGMMIGPSQVAARLLELSVLGKLHPTWSARGAVFLFFLGLALLIPAHPVLAFIAMALYGAGNGLITIVRGTLPLALFGSHGYGTRMGLLARPMLIAQAIAPLGMAMVLSEFGPVMLISTLTALAFMAFLVTWRLPLSA
ncbi:MFS transporter [Achromobacter sp. F4_2707]|uniref:MFS transporter n=1 Tax=Achromobacter sp. F4_2707 TaxID=3114286 RepID=UPI0039C61D3C